MWKTKSETKSETVSKPPEILLAFILGDAHERCRSSADPDTACFYISFTITIQSF